MPTPITLAAKLASFDDAWNPRIVAELNGQEVRLAKLRGEFVWHAHEDADEMFLVLEGAMRMEVRGRATDPSSGRCFGESLTGGPVSGTALPHRTHTLHPGDMIVIPRGVEHRPSSHPPESTCSVLLFEPAGVVNTGTAAGTPAAEGLTRPRLDRV